ncbi:hypothetical protein BGX33_000343 [Mortierella sp. NVP41]|nr:hypothetical protein BGX33_000343 [Mortierella sp. NVP41]
MTSPSYFYDPLEDSEFDETDNDDEEEEEEQDETENDEEEQEQDEEEWDDNEQDEFKDAEEHNNADDQRLGTLTSNQNDSDPPFRDNPEEDEDLSQSPLASRFAMANALSEQRMI